MGPIDYFSCIDVVSILPNELSIFLAVKAFEQKNLHELIPFCTHRSRKCYFL